MPAWLLPALLGAGGLFGSFKAQGQRAAQWRRIMDMMKWAQNPENVLGETRGLYEGMLRSPMYTAAQNDVMSGAQSAQNSLASRMVGSGVSGGVNAMSRAVGASLPGVALSQLRGGLWNNALGTTQQNITNRINAAAGVMTTPSGAEMNMGSLLASLGPLIRMLLMKQGRGNFGTMSGQAEGPLMGQPNYTWPTAD